MTEAKLPESSLLDLSIVPYEACPAWARNVEYVLNQDSPMMALQMWMMENPQDISLYEPTYQYIMQSDIRESYNFYETAVEDCNAAERGTEGSI